MRTLIFISYMCFLSCNNSHSGRYWNGHDNAVVTPFEIYVPDGYQLKKLQGIDSYVGEIFNDSITFSFDYGMYGSGSAPMSITSLEKQIRSAKSEVIATACFDGAVSAKRLSKQIKVLKVISNPDIQSNESIPYALEIDYKGVKCIYPDRYLRKEKVDQMFAYEQIEKTYPKFISKIYWPRSDTLNYAGALMTRSNDMIHLSIYTRDYNVVNASEIKRVLNDMVINFEL